ncbi:LacI family DNA-binding transcriptional regulator [Streptomyces griseiscabiei]|uniref:LacI family DNA-binding transcriptional regulator n=1 Tax=Streptomyces griseiscabiei TaxID=2993540 RepID=A0ABU4LH88_9ACTN|nr:LacI family DNA-binding transcriptional regulator [Streptomyces griseiscabiei]MBZ3900376.1 LacI family DNA-binding transcriptional regulator [Streptomyces griseiscabiei]MDX2914544.1 LacI family DNA-binding transcriptional regulator [Streptomyces griseiscabiei]
MTDIARRAGVSQATVSYVLNNVEKQSISEQTRRAVLDAAKALDYRTNHNARSLASGVSSTVVCVVPPVQLGEPILGLLGELTLEFARRDFVLAVHFEQAGDESLEAMKKALRPMAVFPLLSPHGRVPSGAQPGSSSEPGARLQVTYLAERGHRRLAFAAPAVPSLTVQWAWRLSSAEGAAEELGLPEMVSAEFLLDGSDARDIIRRWHSSGVTAVCAHNDDVAFAVLRGIRENGLRCPEDIAVIGYDATTLGATSDPPLTSIHWETHQVASMLAAQILGAEVPGEKGIQDRYSVAVKKGESA